jgi:hypothetical protein
MFGDAVIEKAIPRMLESFEEDDINALTRQKRRRVASSRTASNDKHGSFFRLCPGR